MLDLNNLAQPYATALFKIAQDSNSVDFWQGCLQQLSDIGNNLDFKQLITNPQVSQEEVLAVLLGVLEKPGQTVIEFLKLLQKNRRLNLLSEINLVFIKKVEESKGIATAIIQSPFPMNDADKKDFEIAIGKKLGLNITATVELKPELIGGIKILVNDLVIDASIKNSLSKMATKLI